MINEAADAGTAQAVSLTMAGGITESLSARGRYCVECRDADGALKWQDVIENVVTTVGKNDILDKYFAGAAYTQTIVMGLKGTGSAVIGDTQASHASWLEVGLANAPTYTGNRKVPAFNAASAGSKATTATAFAITSTGTVAGCFINNGGSSTIDNTTGVLYSAGDFSGGSRAVISGDTLNVTYTASV